MSAIAEATEQAPVAASEATPVVQEAPAPAPTLETIRNLAPEERDRVLFGRTNKAEERPAVVDKPPEVVKPVDETPPVDPEPEKLLPNRISTQQFDEREQEAIALRRDLAKSGEPISLLEALQRVEAKYQGPKPLVESKPVDAETPTETEQPQSRSQQLAAEIQALEAEFDQFNDGLVTPEYNALNRKYAAKMSEHSAAVQSEQQEARERQRDERTQRGSAREQSKDAVLKDYPQADDDDSLIGSEVARIFHEIQADPNHPDRNRFHQDDGPKWLVEKAAARLAPRIARDFGLTEEQALQKIKGTTPAKTEAPIPAKTAPATKVSTAVPRTVLVTSPGSNQATETTMPTLQQLKEQARKDPSIRDAALGFNGHVVV